MDLTTVFLSGHETNLAKLLEKFPPYKINKTFKILIYFNRTLQTLVNFISANEPIVIDLFI